jgi:hypothetical protein
VENDTSGSTLLFDDLEELVKYLWDSGDPACLDLLLAMNTLTLKENASA